MQKAEDFEIDTQNWQDIKEYQANERRAARESLVGRLQEAQRWKELALEEHSMALSAVHEEFQHKREDWLAIKEASQDEKASKRRKSTAFRLKSWKEQRVQDEKKQLLNKVLEEEESNFREMERQVSSLYCEVVFQSMVHITYVLRGDVYSDVCVGM